jgi:hypothetical protein
MIDTLGHFMCQSNRGASTQLPVEIQGYDEKLLDPKERTLRARW